MICFHDNSKTDVFLTKAGFHVGKQSCVELSFARQGLRVSTLHCQSIRARVATFCHSFPYVAAFCPHLPTKVH